MFTKTQKGHKPRPPMGSMRRSSRRPVDRKHEHGTRRQQNVVLGEQRTYQVHALHAHGVRSTGPSRGLASHRQPLRYGLHRLSRARLETVRANVGSGEILAQIR